MHLRGQYSNPSGPLKALLEAISEIPDGPSTSSTEAKTYVLPRLRMGAIRAMVLIVLGEAKEPMRVREVHASVAQRLQLAVSYDTVANFLSVAAKNPSTGVIRVRYGTYRAAPAIS
jgi:hypothetical protein